MFYCKMDKHTFDTVFSSIVVLNYGRDCWRGCGRQQGECDWCGSGVCCRKGWWDTRNGCDGSIGIARKGHVCVEGKVSYCSKYF